MQHFGSALLVTAVSDPYPQKHTGTICYGASRQHRKFKKYNPYKERETQLQDYHSDMVEDEGKNFTLRRVSKLTYNLDNQKLSQTTSPVCTCSAANIT